MPVLDTPLSHLGHAFDTPRADTGRLMASSHGASHFHLSRRNGYLSRWKGHLSSHLRAICAGFKWARLRVGGVTASRDASSGSETVTELFGRWRLSHQLCRLYPEHVGEVAHCIQSSSTVVALEPLDGAQSYVGGICQFTLQHRPTNAPVVQRRQCDRGSMWRHSVERTGRVRIGGNDGHRSQSSMMRIRFGYDMDTLLSRP